MSQVSAAAAPSLSKDVILAKMQEMLKSILSLESAEILRPEASLRDDLHIDSLGMVDLVIGVEETFGVKMRSDLNLLERVKTVGDAVDLVVELSHARHG
jgi:acyl carrier protein